MTDIVIRYNPSSINPIEEYAVVKPSKIHGFGLFAKKLIPKGTVWWHAREQDVMIITKDQFIILDTSIKSPQIENFMIILLNYSYCERDIDALIFILDNNRYVNHSFKPNSGLPEDGTGLRSVAQRDIQIGEEITEDYSKYTIFNWLKKYNEFFDPSCW
ncbi:MAG: SET domain-containing protein [Candidatus Lokiarchaeota archaeon]|nr:SET domain-containing protein [Candidatus Lokiarchaeota archaeon]